MDAVVDTIEGLPALVIELFILAWEYPFAAVGLVGFLAAAVTIGGILLHFRREDRATARRNRIRYDA